MWAHPEHRTPLDPRPQPGYISEGSRSSEVTSCKWNLNLCSWQFSYRTSRLHEVTPWLQITLTQQLRLYRLMPALVTAYVTVAWRYRGDSYCFCRPVRNAVNDFTQWGNGQWREIAHTLFKSRSTQESRFCGYPGWKGLLIPYPWTNPVRACSCCNSFGFSVHIQNFRLWQY